MADTKKKIKKPAPIKETTVSPVAQLDRKKQVRLTFGLFFLLLGVFTCFAITSYFFTWQTDQDKVFDMRGIFHFMFRSQAPVANWGGQNGRSIIAHIGIQGCWYCRNGYRVLDHRYWIEPCI